MFWSRNMALLAGAILLASLLGAADYGRRTERNGADASQPLQDCTSRVYTSITQVRCIAVDSSGGIWAGTSGGVLHWDRSLNRPKLWTAANGLAGNDVVRIDATEGCVEVTTTAGESRVPTGAPKPQFAPNRATKSTRGATPPLPPGGGPAIARASFPGGYLVAAPTGLWRLVQRRWSLIPLPQNSPASHVSALLAGDGTVYATLFGDGLYRLDGSRWSCLSNSAPFRYVTSLAVQDHRLIVGTADSGVFACSTASDSIEQLPLAAIPQLPNADIESVAKWRGCIWLATFDHGIECIEPSGTVTITPTIEYPRTLLSDGKRLYCRDADGRLWSLSGSVWKPASFIRWLPRPAIYCCSIARGHLYVGGWGGWASIEGSRIICHYCDRPLANQVVTFIAAAGSAVWIGTQDNGLLRYQNGSYEQFHEAQGLTDDWVTAIDVSSRGVLVGTYTGGLLELRGGRLVRELTAGGFAIRSIATSSDGAAYAATPVGVYVRRPGSAASEWRLLNPALYGGKECQCLSLAGSEVWIGSRTALACVGPASAAQSRGVRLAAALQEKVCSIVDYFRSLVHNLS